MQQTTLSQNKIVSLYPLTRFYIALALVVVSIASGTIAGRAVCFVLINLLAAASGCYRVFIRRTFLSVGVLFLLLLFIQTFFYPGETVLFRIWIFSAKLEGLLFALGLGLLLADVGAALLWFFAITPERDFVLSLKKKGLSPQASYVVLSSLQIVPVLKKRSQTIMNAQRARGVETEGNFLIRVKAFFPVLVPLVLSAISGVEERALTLEARGFSVKGKPTYLYDIEERPIDRTVNWIVLAAVVLFLAGRVSLWLL